MKCSLIWSFLYFDTYINYELVLKQRSRPSLPVFTNEAKNPARAVSVNRASSTWRRGITSSAGTNCSFVEESVWRLQPSTPNRMKKMNKNHWGVGLFEPETTKRALSKTLNVHAPVFTLDWRGTPENLTTWAKRVRQHGRWLSILGGWRGVGWRGQTRGRRVN